MSLKIVVIVFVLSIAVAVGKFYERCELATEMRDKHSVPIDQVGNWVCEAHYATNFTTSTSSENESGIFLIHNSWCAPNGGCEADCDNFLDDDISDDVACMKKIHAALGYFKGWGKYSENNCGNRSSEFIQGCFEDTDTATDTSTTRVTSSTPQTSTIHPDSAFLKLIM